MSDLVVDSSVVAKWLLPEADSTQALQLVDRIVASGEQLFVLDLAYSEVANAIWKRYRQKLIELDEARQLVDALVRCPVTVVASLSVLDTAFEIAAKYDRAIYDALFVALAQQRQLPGITADEPLFHAVCAEIPWIVLLRDFV